MGLSQTSKIHMVQSSEQEASRGGGLRVPSPIYNAGRGVRNALNWNKTPTEPMLPVSNDPQLEDEANSTTAIPSIQKLALMTCAHCNWEDMVLLQGRVDHVKTDCDFFAFLKALVRQRRSHIMRIISCRKILAIHFTMVSLPLSRYCAIPPNTISVQTSPG